MFETQDNDVIAKLLGPSDIQIYEQRRVTPFDCFVLGYCVAHSNCTWSIVLGFGHIGDEDLKMLVQGATEVEAHCTGGISEIDLNKNYITSEGLKHLLSFPKQVINKLETLYLYRNEFDSESCVISSHMCLI